MYENKTLAKMKPGAIVSAIRENDLSIIRKLCQEGVKKGVWTQSELAEMLDVNISTVSRWINYEKTQ